jgi:iron complex transport system substrate-binding protein
LPPLTAPKFDIDGASYRIDERVKAIVENGLALYRVEGERLRALRPDVIFTQSQCEVCAVSERELLDVVGDWLGTRPDIVSLSPETLADMFDDIGRVAASLGSAGGGQALVDGLKGRMTAIAEKARTLDVRPTIACIEWIDPLMAAGNWMPELVEMAGGVSVVGRPGEHAPWLQWDDLVTLDPDVIIALPCGFDIARTRRELPTLTMKPEWSNLQAVAGGRVYLADGNHFFNRPGPRVVEALEIMAEILHPQCFEFGHGGVGWEPLELGEACERP